MPNSEKFVARRPATPRMKRDFERACTLAALNAGGKPGDVPAFVPDGTPLPADSPRDERGQLRDAAARALSGPDGETINAMSYGEQVVEALGEFVDAKISYAQAYQSVGGEWTNPEPVNKAADRLTKLLDRKVKVRL